MCCPGGPSTSSPGPPHLGVSLLDPKSTHFGSYWDPVWTPFGGVCLTLDGGDHQDPRPTGPRGRSLGIPVCVLLRAAALALAGTTPFGGVHLTPKSGPRDLRSEDLGSRPAVDL